MTSEAVGIDSESLLFAKLQEHKFEIPNLISRRLYNDRRKSLHPYAIQSVKEWPKKSTETKIVSALTLSR